MRRRTDRKSGLSVHQSIPISRALSTDAMTRRIVDRQQLDIDELDLDIARDHQSLVEDPLEDIGKCRRVNGMGRGPRRIDGHDSNP